MKNEERFSGKEKRQIKNYLDRRKEKGTQRKDDKPRKVEKPWSYSTWYTVSQYRRTKKKKRRRQNYYSYLFVLFQVCCVRTKIVTNNSTLEQVSRFKYLGCAVSYKSEYDMREKISTYRNICGTMHRNLKNKTRHSTRIKFYKTIAIPSTLIYASEAWVCLLYTSRCV